MENEFIERLKELAEKAEKDIKIAEAEIKRAEEAGIDVTEERRKLEEQKLKLSKIKSVYLAKKE